MYIHSNRKGEFKSGLYAKNRGQKICSYFQDNISSGDKITGTILKNDIVKLKFIKYMNKFMFYCNNRLLTSIEIDDYPKDRGYVGLISEYGGHIEFDNFKVYSIK